METPTFAEQFRIPDVPEAGNRAVFTGEYLPVLADLHGRKIGDARGKMIGVSAHGAMIDGAVMFIDIGAYTARSRGLTGGQVNFWVNRFWNLLWPFCEQAHATFDKTIGDAMLLVFSPNFGCPAPFRSAINLALAALGNDFYGYEPHCGIAEGKFWLGHVGPPSALSLSVLGEVVNIAARLSAKAGDRAICVTKESWDRVKEEVVPGANFSVTKIRRALKGFGPTQLVKLACKIHWVPQLHNRIILTDEAGAVESSPSETPVTP